MAKQITTFIANQPGALAEYCRILRDAGVDKRAINDTEAMDNAIDRAIVDDTEKEYDEL